jgi:hypothetical protein
VNQVEREGEIAKRSVPSVPSAEIEESRKEWPDDEIHLVGVFQEVGWQSDNRERYRRGYPGGIDALLPASLLEVRSGGFGFKFNIHQ